MPTFPFPAGAGLPPSWPTPVLGQVTMPTLSITVLLVLGGLLALIVLVRALKTESRGSAGLLIALAFAVTCGWMGYVVGEARGDLTATRDSHTALLEGLSRQVDQLGEQVAHASEGFPGFARSVPQPVERPAPAPQPAPPPAAQAALPLTVDAAAELHDAVTELRRAVDALAGASSVLARGPQDGPAPPADLAALKANAISRSTEEVMGEHFGWSPRDLLARYGRPDQVRAEDRYVYWSYDVPLQGGATAQAVFKFLDGALIGFWKQGLPK